MAENGTRRLAARVGLVAFGLVVPGAAGARYASWVAARPVTAVLLTLGYELALVAVGFAVTVFGGLEKKWTERAVTAVDQRWQWRRTLPRYLHHLRAVVRDMETVGIATQGEFVLRIDQVYVDVGVAPQALHAAAGEPYVGVVGDGEAGRRRSLASVLRDAERGEGSRVMALIGGPGSGKTTLVRSTALSLCGRRWRPGARRLPVLMYLRDHKELLAKDPPGLAALACGAPWLRDRVAAGWLERWLERGRCLVLLDGLDEVGDAEGRTRAVAWAVRQTARYPGNLYVVTSRPHGYATNPLPSADVLQVRRFTPAQVGTFLRKWSYAVECRARGASGPEVRAGAEARARDLLDRLRAQPALYDLAANPLLLTMTANVHRYRDALPGSRSELYAEMCDVLLHRRAEVRGLRDATGLKGRQKQLVVQHLALAMMRAGVRDWPLAKVVRAIQEPLRKVPGTVAPEVFTDAAVKSGLLVEREHGVFGFAHLTLQEYLAAAQLGDSRNNGRTDLARRVDDPWWRETILLWAAANDASAVITACLASGTVAALALALDCADEARTVDLAVRDRLEAVLQPSEVNGAVHRRMLAGILATRELRRRIPLEDGASVGAEPVSRRLWGHFGIHDGFLLETVPAPAARVRCAGQAERFVAWLRDVTGDPAYRLPTPAELSDPTVAEALGPHTAWAGAAGVTVLHRPPGVPWPHEYAADRLREVAAADLAEHAVKLRHYAADRATRERDDACAIVLARALLRPAVPESVLLVGLVRASRLVRVLLLGGGHPGAAPDDALVRTWRREMALCAALGAVPQVENGDVAWGPDPAEVAFQYAEALESVLVTILSSGHPDVHDLAPLDVARCRRSAADLERTASRDYLVAVERLLHPVLDRVLSRQAGLESGAAGHPGPVSGLDVIAALAVERLPDMRYGTNSRELLALALPTLLALARPAAAGFVPPGALEDLLATAAADPLPPGRRAAEDPERCLRPAHEMLVSTGSPLVPLTQEALAVVRRIRAGAFPPSSGLLTRLRLALLTAAVAVEAGRPGREPGTLLREAWQGLIGLEDPKAPGNQVLMIVRDPD